MLHVHLETKFNFNKTSTMEHTSYCLSHIVIIILPIFHEITQIEAPFIKTGYWFHRFVRKHNIHTSVKIKSVFGRHKIDLEAKKHKFTTLSFGLNPRWRGVTNCLHFCVCVLLLRWKFLLGPEIFSWDVLFPWKRVV